MLSSEEQMHIIKSAIAEGYKGEIFKLIDQASVEKGATAQNQEQQEQGLRGSDGNTAMAFPNSDQDFNTQGMNFDLDLRKYDKEGNLVKSYQKVPPGIKSLNMGEEEGTVIETPSQYQDGGFDKDAFINQFLEEEKTGTTKTAKNKSILSNTISTTDGSKYYKEDGTPMTFEQKNVKVTNDSKATKKHIIQAKKDVKEFVSDPVNIADAVGATGIPIISEAGDLVSAGISHVRGDKFSRDLSLAGIAVPFAGGAILKQSAKGIKAIKGSTKTPVIGLSQGRRYDYANKVFMDAPPPGPPALKNTVIDPDLTHRKFAADRTTPVRGGHKFEDLAEEYNWLDQAGQTNPNVTRPFNPQFDDRGMTSFDLEKLTDYKNVSEFKADHLRKTGRSWAGAEKDLFKSNLTNTMTDLHGKGFQHLDLHSGNIMLKGDAAGKVLDYKLIDPVGYTESFRDFSKFKDFDVKGFRGGDVGGIKDLKYGGFQKGGYRRKQYQDAGFIGPQLPPGYVGPKNKEVEETSEPVVEKENKVVTNKVVKKKTKNRTKTSNKTYSTDRPRSSKDIKKMQELLISEGFNVGETGADGSWGDNTQEAYDTYKSRTDSKEVGWMDRLRGIYSKFNNHGVSQSVETYAQYAGNALLQGYGLVGEDETFFDVTEKDLRPDELASYKSMLRDNFNKGRGSKIDYRGYSNDPEISNASSSEAARKLLEARGITNTILNDWSPFSGTNATKEALHTLTGNASYNIDKDGNVYVQDNYDFNYSQNKKGLKTGTTISELYKHATANKYDGSGYDNAHSVGDQVKSRIPVNINLGSATDLGLTPNEISQLGEYNPNASNVKTISTLELLKRGTKKVFGFQEGGFNPDHLKPTLKFPPQFPQGRIEKGASWDLKKGVRALESSNGVNMKNSKTPATGFYGQFFNQIKDLPFMNGVTRDEFAADTTLQNKVFDMRYKGQIPDVPGLKSNVKKLRKDYKELTKDYTDDELAALSNFTGRKRAREYFASTRDGKPFKMPGQDAGDNKSVEQYMKEFRDAVNKKKMGGKRKCKYGCW